MQVWNVLHAAHWKYRTQKVVICAPSYNFVGVYLRNWGMYRQLEKILLNINTLFPHNMANFGPLTAEIGLVVLGPSKFQRVSRLGSVTARQSNFCTTEKRMKFATKPRWYYPPHLSHVATLPWEIKTSNFLQILKKQQTNSIFNHLCLCYSSTNFNIFAV